MLGQEHLHLARPGLFLFFLQATCQRECEGLTVEVAIGIVVGVDADAPNRLREPQLLQIAGAEPGPYRLGRSQVHGQTGLDALADGKFVGGLEEPHRGPVDPGRQHLLGVGRCQLAAVLQIGPVQRHAMPIGALDARQHGRVFGKLARLAFAVLLEVPQRRMEAQHSGVHRQREAATPQIAIHFVTGRHRSGLFPYPLGKLLHAFRGRLGGHRWPRHHRCAHTLLDLTQRGVEVDPLRRLQQLEAAAGATGAAVVVALAELVGVLEPIRAAAERAGPVALLQDAFFDTQAAEDFGPAPVCASLDLIDAGGVLKVLHGALLDPRHRPFRANAPAQHPRPP